jgi:hypothetical protein
LSGGSQHRRWIDSQDAAGGQDESRGNDARHEQGAPDTRDQIESANLEQVGSRKGKSR